MKQYSSFCSAIVHYNLKSYYDNHAHAVTHQIANDRTFKLLMITIKDVHSTYT